MFLEGNGGLRLDRKMPDLLAQPSWNWWHVEVMHMPVGLPDCAGLVGGKLSLGCWQGFQL